MRQSVADVLVEVAHHRFELFHDEQGRPWAWDGRDALPVGSSAFGERLAKDLYEVAGKAPGQASVSSAINTLRAIARWDGPEIPVWLRVGAHQDSVVVDLGDTARQVVVVTPTGRLLTTESPVRFYRPPGMQALPVPVAGGSLADVLDLWPVRDDELVLLAGWLVGCFNPSGPKPVLDLAGTQGSGKSVLARLLRSVVDPNAVPLGTLPSDPRNLAVIVARHAVPAFDNVSVISDEISDALSRLASGMGFESRRLYTDEDLTTFAATRPVLLTGIPDVAKQPDLVDRTITIALAEFGPGERRTEAEVLADFEEIRPALFGLLLDAVSSALANLPSTVLDVTPRMLDFATWVEAGAPAFGWEPGRFLAAYLGNRRDASIAAIEGSVIGQFVEQLAETGFTGTAAECLERCARLARLAGHEPGRQRGWPATPRGLAGVLRRLKPSLAEAGIVVEFEGSTGQHQRRIIRLHMAGSLDAGGAVVPFAKPAPSIPELVTDALRAEGTDSTWPPSTLVALALGKAGGNAFVAARALNALDIPSPRGGPWTADIILSVG
jgi:hypothetical protein